MMVLYYKDLTISFTAVQSVSFTRKSKSQSNQNYFLRSLIFVIHRNQYESVVNNKYLPL